MTTKKEALNRLMDATNRGVQIQCEIEASIKQAKDTEEKDRLLDAWNDVDRSLQDGAKEMVEWLKLPDP